MKDAAVLLPFIVQLADSAKLNKHATDLEVMSACERYENEMIPRTFAWVQKSGGTLYDPLLYHTLAKICVRRQSDANQFKHILWQACFSACGTGVEFYMVVLHSERVVHVGDIFGRCTRACLLAKVTCFAICLGYTSHDHMLEFFPIFSTILELSISEGTNARDTRIRLALYSVLGMNRPGVHNFHEPYDAVVSTGYASSADSSTKLLER